MKKIFSILFLLFMSLNVSADYNRNVSEYNLNSLGQGLIDRVTNTAFDPVAAFPEGGATAMQGDNAVSYTHEGVEYLFSSEGNRDRFLVNPKKYEPTYGGYCAFAMASGQKVEIQAKHFLIRGNRIHYFVNSRAKRNFERNFDALEQRADENWELISGELPRL
ncbi:MAG: YHS domain-containing (seleno)protein [Bdellovibrionota bacterium]|nr:YHS domain-containing (seleno)protein [Bdellovibrionota bacterium]